MTADDSLPGWAREMIGELMEHPAAPDARHIADWRQDCWCRACQLNNLILAYMFMGMEPTDRALRPAESREPAS